LINFGSLAKDRESQVLNFALEHPYTSFSGDDVCKYLFENRLPKNEFYSQRLIESYRVACEDLRRKQILKGVHEVDGLSYILNNQHQEVKEVKNE